MVSRFLPNLKTTKRYKYNARISGFVLEILYTKYGNISFADKYNRIPNFNIRIELDKVRNAKDQKIKVADSTIPFSTYFKQYGFPKIGDVISFTAKLAVKDTETKAFKFVNSIKYSEQSKRKLGITLKHKDSYNFALWGYLQAKYPTKIVRNQEGKIELSSLSIENSPFRVECSDKLYRYINRYGQQLYHKIRLDILEQLDIKQYQSLKNESDIIYIRNNSIITKENVNKEIIEKISELGYLNKQNFYQKFSNMNHVIDICVPWIYKKMEEEQLNEIKKEYWNYRAKRIQEQVAEAKKEKSVNNE